MKRHPLSEIADVFKQGVLSDYFDLDGLKIDIKHEGGTHITGLATEPFLSRPAGSIIRDRYELPPGNYVTVWFPNSLAVDLMIRSRSVSDDESEGLESHFEISYGCEHLSRQYLDSGFAEMLLTLAPNYVVQMRDDRVWFGPLYGDGQNATPDIQCVVDSVLAFEASRSATVSFDEYVGDDAEFCFFCGFNVSPNTLECPQCHGDLRDEP